jgi:hypothetical protein
MKVAPRADSQISVRPRSWDEDSRIAVHYEGVYDVTLNNMVTISFVPNLGTAAPPFDRSQLPPDLDDVGTPEQARLEAALHAGYVVTPCPRRASTSQSLPIPEWSNGPAGVVFYVTAEQFELLTADLAVLACEIGTLHSEVAHSQLVGHPAVDFVAELVSAPPFAGRDTYWLRDEDYPQCSPVLTPLAQPCCARSRRGGA